MMRRRPKKPRFKTAAARRLYADEKSCRTEDRRLRAIRSLVHDLNANIADVEILMLTAPHRYSREVQFSLFVSLPYLPYQDRELEERLLHAVESYLINVDTRAACAAWMAGDMLAHCASNRTSQTKPEIDMLLKCALEARFVAGRLGALHGIEHALDCADSGRGRRLLKVVAQLLHSDKSSVVRDRAHYVLESGGCWNEDKADRTLRAYARRLLRTRKRSTR